MRDGAILVRGDRLSGLGDLQCDDGVPMETPWHRHAMLMLIETARAAVAPRAAYVSGNQFIYFSKHQVRKNDFRGPDFYLVVDVPTHERKYWASWEEDGRLPDVVVEITSESTEHIDRGEKFRIYDQIWGVQAYYLWDPIGFRLEGWARGPEGLEPLEMGADGRLDCAFLGLRLGPWTGQYISEPYTYLRWYSEAGELFPTLRETAEAQRDAAQFDALRAAGDAARARSDAHEVKSELAQARADEAEARTEAADARTEAAEARTEAAEARTEAAEARTEAAEARARAAEARTEAAEARARAAEARAGADDAAARIAELESMLAAKRS